jgi:branched-chain amino acid transport system substrate-binding protein
MIQFARLALIAVLGGVFTPAQAQEMYKIGASVGLSGYIAFIDGPWKDGIALAIESINKSGGILGHKFELVAEDMRSEPAEAVTVARKLINSDKVIALINGCSSAGNAAMAPLVARAEIPMLLCSILPPKKEDHKWAFSYIPPPAFDIEVRLAYLKQTGKTKVGVLFDPTPYSGLQKRVMEGLAPKFGVTIVGSEQFKPNDNDMTAYVTKLQAAGAEVLVVMGSGSATITAAKAVKQLGLKTPVLASTVDMNVVQASVDAIGTQFMFPAQRTQVLHLLPKNDPGLKATNEFMALWTAKHGDRDPTWAARGWDAMQTVAAGMRKANSAEGSKIRDAIENNLSLVGASGDLTFTADQHLGVRTNPYLLSTVVDGKVVLVK